MSKIPTLSRQKANAVSAAVFFVGCIYLLITGEAWPGLAAVIGVSLVSRQLMRARPFDAFLSLFCFSLLIFLPYAWAQAISMPAAITLLVREALHIRRDTAQQKTEEFKAELEDEKG